MFPELKTQTNEARCSSTWETHVLELAACCPITQNPQLGSYIEIIYTPTQRMLEVAALRAYVDSFVGGRGEIRSMEGMIQAIAQDCAIALDQTVKVKAFLNIEPRQKMLLDCTAYP